MPVISVSQLNRYVGAIANRGTVYNLTLLDKVTDINGEVIKDYESEVHHEIEGISEDAWNLVQKGMEMMVENSSQFAGKMNGFKMAGKTGTAQQSETHADHALFVGYAPAEKPEIAIAVRIANGYSSAYTAEIGRDIVRIKYKLADIDSLITGGSSVLGTDIHGD